MTRWFLLTLALLASVPRGASAENDGFQMERPVVIGLGNQLPATLYSERPAGTKVDTVVVHFISAIEVDAKKAYDFAAILRLFQPDPAQSRAATSAHYLIERSGSIHRLVPEVKRAWHAGASKMPPPDNREVVNDFSIGIELVMTPKDSPTTAQYEVLARLLCEIKARHPELKAGNIVGHDMVRAHWNLAHPEKPAFVKTDPGPLFHWSRLMHRLAELKFAE